jgi:hypothetical protein
MFRMKAKPKIFPLGAGEAMHFLGDDVISVMPGADTGGAYAVQRQEVQPGTIYDHGGTYFGTTRAHLCPVGHPARVRVSELTEWCAMKNLA